MKNMFKTFAFLAFLACFFSCADAPEYSVYSDNENATCEFLYGIWQCETCTNDSKCALMGSQTYLLITKKLGIYYPEKSDTSNNDKYSYNGSASRPQLTVSGYNLTFKGVLANNTSPSTIESVVRFPEEDYFVLEFKDGPTHTFKKVAELEQGFDNNFVLQIECKFYSVGDACVPRTKVFATSEGTKIDVTLDATLSVEDASIKATYENKSATFATNNIATTKLDGRLTEKNLLFTGKTVALSNPKFSVGFVTPWDSWFASCGKDNLGCKMSKGTWTDWVQMTPALGEWTGNGPFYFIATHVGSSGNMGVEISADSKYFDYNIGADYWPTPEKTSPVPLLSEGKYNYSDTATKSYKKQFFAVKMEKNADATYTLKCYGFDE